MPGDPSSLLTGQWAKASGDAWARRWKDTDAALEALSPALLQSISASAPEGTLSAFEIGCGPGSTTLAVTDAFPDAEITACDISPSLVEIARGRTAHSESISIELGDAEAVASAHEASDVVFSRHGVMFFEDPVRAFTAFRRASTKGAGFVFSCFRSWDLNPWASELAPAAAGHGLPTPGREPSGFAFADPDYVREILESAGWTAVDADSISFDYFAGPSPEEALSFLSELGPASRALQALPDDGRPRALERMRAVIETHFGPTGVLFPAAAWIWRARAA